MDGPAARVPGPGAGPTWPRARRAGLAAFAGLLRENGILPREPECLGQEDTLQKCAFIAQEDTLQKCAFIAQEGFGLGLGYEYHLIEYGTFSSFLAADYHGLVEEGAPPGGLLMRRPFDERAFLALVSGKGERWLALASTMVHEMGSCGEGQMLGHVRAYAPTMRRAWPGG